jgi:hypothetical protein
VRLTVRPPSLLACRACPRHPLPRLPADPADPSNVTEETRTLGLVVCRGPNITVLAPEDGMEEIENPFAAPPAEEGEAAGEA